MLVLDVQLLKTESSKIKQLWGRLLLHKKENKSWFGVRNRPTIDTAGEIFWVRESCYS